MTGAPFGFQRWFAPAKFGIKLAVKFECKFDDDTIKKIKKINISTKKIKKNRRFGGGLDPQNAYQKYIPYIGDTICQSNRWLERRWSYPAPHIFRHVCRKRGRKEVPIFLLLCSSQYDAGISSLPACGNVGMRVVGGKSAGIERKILFNKF